MERKKYTWKSTQSSGAIIVATFSEIERWYRITLMAEELKMKAIKCSNCQKKLIWCESKKLNLLTHLKIIACQVCERIVQTVNYEKAIEKNNLLEVKVDEQQHNKKHALEQCDIDNEDKFQENTAAITPITKRIYLEICV